MTSNEIAIPTAADPLPGRARAGFLGQATQIEQARAVAEVQAAIVVAQQCPRDVNTAMRSMREACQQPGLAERAFYRFSRGGQQVSGESVHLARELARCWGNIQHGIQELRRDDAAGISEMQAFAWDVQTNTRAAHIFVVPHRRDSRNGSQPLTDMRDIYENNTNQASRRLREAIFAVLPVWFREEAKDLCHKTLETGGGKSLASRIADAVQVFEGKGVTLTQLEAKVGRPSDKWTAHDVAQLGVVYKSIDRGEITVDDEFPTVERAVTADEINQQQSTKRRVKQPPPAAQPADPEPSGLDEFAPTADQTTLEGATP